MGSMPPIGNLMACIPKLEVGLISTNASKGSDKYPFSFTGSLKVLIHYLFW